MNKIYKVTSASIGETKRKYKVFKLQLNNSIWATKLFPQRDIDRKNNKLYQLYTENNSIDFLIGKYISLSITQSQYGYEFSAIESIDALQDFKKEVDASNGKVFATRLPIYDFLSSIKRRIEPDGSIKINSDFGDMRVSKINEEVDICYQFDEFHERLNFSNIEHFFDKVDKDVPFYVKKRRIIGLGLYPMSIYDFLSSMKQKIEPDGSIKLNSDFEDMRISKINGSDICYQFDESNERLNFSNIEQIFDKFYKDVPLPAYDPSEGGSKSYYKHKTYAIVRMDNHVKVSYKMTTSGDYDKWLEEAVLQIGDKLPDDQVQFLKSCSS